MSTRPCSLCPTRGAAGSICCELRPVVKAWFYRDKDLKLVPRTAARFEQKKKSEMGKSAADRNTTHTLMLAEWALTHGLHTKFEEIMDELAKDEKNNPIVLTYQKVKGELARKIDQLPAGSLYDRVRRVGKFDSPPDNQSLHYTVLHHLDKDKTVVSARVKMLEHNLKGFYYWWAKRGLALPMPREPPAGDPDQ